MARQAMKIGSAEQVVFDALRSYGYINVRTFTSRSAFREHMKETAVEIGKEAGSILGEVELGVIGADCARWAWDRFYGRGAPANARRLHAISIKHRP
jgi:hypothetical protein